MLTKDAESGFSNTNDDTELNLKKRETAIRCLKITLKFVIWALLFALFIHLEFGLVYFICSLLFFICYNTNKRKKGRLSPYSVFNRNLERMKTVSKDDPEDNIYNLAYEVM